MDTTTIPMPKENLFRATFPAVELRAADGEDTGPVLSGHFAVFNKWTEINSMWEGRFMERIAPGAFSKTFTENRDRMRVLFQHGQDPVVGDKPLGPIDRLEEDKTGGYYEVPLLDTSYVRDLIPGLEKGLYGASFRFQVMREEIEEEPKPSADNPNGLPERTIREARVMEFGPVTFPAYAEATAGVRSITDEIMLGALAADPERFGQMLAVSRGGTTFTINSGGNLPLILSTPTREAAPDQPHAAPTSAPGAVAPRTARTHRLNEEEPSWFLPTKKEEPTWRL